MSSPGAKEGDQVVGIDTHVILIPSPAGPIPTPLPMPFSGMLDGDLSATVSVDGKAAATAGSSAQNSPPHVPAGGPFQKTPANKGTIERGSGTVFFEGKEAARLGDTVKTCSDPSDAPNGVVVAAGTVFIGG